MKRTYLLSLVSLILLMTLLVSCGAGTYGVETDIITLVTGNDSVITAEPEKNVTLSDLLNVKVAVLNGTTGFGIAPMYKKLVEECPGETKPSMDFYSDATQIPSLIISGNADIAAVPTNLASVLYKKTEGKIKVLAVNTLGVLYLLENGESVKSLADLEGKTVYVPGQGSNPEYVLRALLEKAGLEGKVTVDYTYSSPDELMTAAVTGKAGLALLPEPKVTAACSKNDKLNVALDISKEWKELNSCELVQGCLICRTEFAENNPELLKLFLEEYEKSCLSVSSDYSAAADAVVFAGIATVKAPVEKALPRCNIVYMTGDDMKTSLNLFWKALYDIIPSSVGGALPDENIFY